jgi:phosphoribosylformylglycinamidine synthase
LLQSAHDCSDGGLAITLAECAFDTDGIGLNVDVPASTSAIAALFGESASRAVVSVADTHVAALLRLAGEHGVPAKAIGRTGGSRITMTVAGSPAIDCTIAEAEHVWANSLGGCFVKASA